MSELNQQLLQKIAPEACKRPLHVRAIQFGEGNFLRAFVDEMIDRANQQIGFDCGVTLVQPIERGLIDQVNRQNGLYTLILRGVTDGEARSDARVVRSVLNGVNPYADFDAYLRLAHQPDVRFIISNTTEAGIVFTGTDRFEDAPQSSFPGKLTRLLYERYKAGLPGFIVLSCELIDENGTHLRECVLQNARLWQLEADFLAWIERENLFCNTLVDRIVTGYPRAEADALCEKLGYEDRLLDVGEPFGLWVIEGPEWLEKEFPLHKAGCPVRFTRDVTPYKLRKVRMLNGAHTSMVCGAYLCGLDTVGEAMADAQLRGFVRGALYEEILPLVPLDRADLEAFAAAVLERFENPYNRHLLLSIALNSVSKYTARVLPSIKAYIAEHACAPRRLTAGFAALIAFYAGGAFDAEGHYLYVRNGEACEILDDAHVLKAFDALNMDMDAAVLADVVCADTSLWGEDLRALPGFEAEVARGLRVFQTGGARALMES